MIMLAVHGNKSYNFDTETRFSVWEFNKFQYLSCFELFSLKFMNLKFNLQEFNILVGLCVIVPWLQALSRVLGREPIRCS